jgi:hypothetical protein
MQHVSAFSRPQTVPPVPAAAPKASLWILNSWRDLILYVGTLLLLVPMFALAQARWSAQDIYVFVAAFGATGHHLPGMIRAYGDRALFEALRLRPDDTDAAENLKFALSGGTPNKGSTPR